MAEFRLHRACRQERCARICSSERAIDFRGSLCPPRRSDKEGSAPSCLAEVFSPPEIGDALLHLLQIVMIFVENLVRSRMSISDCRGLLHGRKHPFQIGPRNHVLRGRRRHFGQPLQLAIALFLASASCPFFHFLAQLVDLCIGIVGFAEFLLDRLHLFAQEVLALVWLTCSSTAREFRNEAPGPRAPSIVRGSRDSSRLRTLGVSVKLLAAAVKRTAECRRWNPSTGQDIDVHARIAIVG